MPRKKMRISGLLPKDPTGIEGFDEVTKGGLPKSRPTLVVGGPGSGKTLFAMEFLVNGAIKFNEPGVFFSFEETEDELIQNVVSLGFNLYDLEAKKMLLIDYIKIEAEEIVETGEYDLEGLFVRLNYAIDSIGAKRVVLDTIESIFSSFSNTLILRSELRRLFRFLKDKGVTAVVTGEKGIDTLTRYGLEEYISDAVIALDTRILNNIATRHLRVIKYRGSAHGSNEYPFLIDEHGFSVLPLTSLSLIAEISNERVSTGIPDLDKMFGGKGYYKDTTVLITGQAGTGKTSFGAEFVRSVCAKGKKALFLTFEESPGQIIRNMRSIGIDLAPFVKKGLLIIQAERSTSYGLETHLVSVHRIIDQFKPDVAILDSISSLMNIGEPAEVRSTLVRLVDYLKMRKVTSLFTDLKHTENPQQSSLISSMVDTWIILEDVESNGEKNRILRLVKSRGMDHSNQIREFLITNEGIKLVEPYIGPAGVLTGSARYAQEAREKAEGAALSEEQQRLETQLKNQRSALAAQMKMSRLESKSKEADLERRIAEGIRREKSLIRDKERMKVARTSGRQEGSL